MDFLSTAVTLLADYVTTSTGKFKPKWCNNFTIRSQTGKRELNGFRQAISGWRGLLAEK
jgi:hypothetical protein